MVLAGEGVWWDRSPTTVLLLGVLLQVGVLLAAYSMSVCHFLVQLCVCMHVSVGGADTVGTVF